MDPTRFPGREPDALRRIDNLTKLMTTYLRLLAEEWDELGDSERRELLERTRQALVRLAGEVRDLRGEEPLDPSE